ncbi:MAG: dihydroorotase [Eggerthellaceae bacterium]|nr:dihydroorotase [Eggerthellaceae bacterium]
MALLLKNAHVIDPQVGLNEVCEILIRDGKIVEVGHDLNLEKGVERDLGGKVVVPGLVDIHVHLRDPGQEYKEDIETGTRAAAHGGFTDVCCMPNTNPIIDTGAVVEYVRSKAARVGKCRVHVSGACTKGEKGEALSEMGDMVAHGAVMFTDDGRGVQDAGMMRRVMDYAVQFGKAVSSHCQDEGLVGSGQINEGAVSTRLGLLGWPSAGEEIQISRDIEISALTGCRLHIQHLSTAHGLDLVRRGKSDGVEVTCEVTPHHMFLTEESIAEDYDTRFKVNPPLRSAEDAEAVIAGVVDGTVDCIVTDHAPHADHEKAREFELAPFGMTGIETSVGLVVSNLVNTGKISWERMVELMSVNPRRIIGIERVAIEPGCRADLTVIDPDLKWTVTEDDFESYAKNSGFLGWELTGRATDVYVGGYATMQDGVITDEPIHL